MKDKVGNKMEEYPETPPWTMFFDGPLYQKYDEFMKNKDFSKILINTKLKWANSSSSGGDIVSSTLSTEDERWEKDKEDHTGNTYQYVTPDYYKRAREDERRRTRRTRAFILLGILVMAALAFGTALVIHYFFVPTEDRNPGNIVNVSFAVNTTEDFPETTSKSPEDEISKMLDIIKEHDHDHKHILNPDGKIFDDTFETHETTTTDSADSDTSHTTTTTSIATTATTTEVTTTEPSDTTVGTTESSVYELHLIPDTSSGELIKDIKVSPTKPIEAKTTTTAQPKILQSISTEPYTTTKEIDPLDFFAMDDLFANNTSSTSSYVDDFFADYADNETVTTGSTPKVTSVPTTSVAEETTFAHDHTTGEAQPTEALPNKTSTTSTETTATGQASTTESLFETTTAAIESTQSVYVTKGEVTAATKESSSTADSWFTDIMETSTEGLTDTTTPSTDASTTEESTTKGTPSSS